MGEHEADAVAEPGGQGSRGGAGRSLAAAVPAPLLVLGSIVSIQVGAALASGLIQQVGAVVTVGLRLAVAAAVMLLLARPGIRGRGRRDWAAVLALGVSLGAMNLCFYSALGRLPLGIVVTIGFLGPLGLAAALSRRPLHLVGVALALAGVVAVSGALHGAIATVDTVGLLFAVGSGALWAVSILATRAVGARWRQLDGLALAMLIGAVLVAPAAAASWGDAAVTWAVVAAAAGVAMLSTVVPYSLELQALRRIDARVFGVLLSLEPGVAALAGLLLLGQRLGLTELAGIGLVVVASALVLREPAGGHQVEPEGGPRVEVAEVG